jgi:hypothetical protein
MYFAGEHPQDGHLGSDNGHEGVAENAAMQFSKFKPEDINAHIPLRHHFARR